VQQLHQLEEVTSRLNEVIPPAIHVGPSIQAEFFATEHRGSLGSSAPALPLGTSAGGEHPTLPIFSYHDRRAAADKEQSG
jgi:hypothetical protein